MSIYKVLLWVGFFMTLAPTGWAQLPGGVRKLSFPANQKGDFHTTIQVVAGDYIYVEAKGEVEISEALGTKIDASGSDNFFFNLSYNRYRDFKHAALLCKIGSTNFVQPFTFSLFELVPSMQRAFVEDMGLIRGRGEYPGILMLAPASGELIFEINDIKLSDNKGNFDLSVYKLTQAQHRQRNRYNHCPQRVEKAKASPLYERDRIGTFFYHTQPELSTWESLKIAGFRGSGTRVGCQCIYDAAGDLINSGLYMGTFDYALARPEYRTSRFMHYILDVIPHLMYRGHLGIDDDTMYSPTPAINIDP